jgi:hypothetical protein
VSLLNELVVSLSNRGQESEVVVIACRPPAVEPRATARPLVFRKTAKLGKTGTGEFQGESPKIVTARAARQAKLT